MTQEVEHREEIGDGSRRRTRGGCCKGGPSEYGKRLREEDMNPES